MPVKAIAFDYGILDEMESAKSLAPPKLLKPIAIPAAGLPICQIGPELCFTPDEVVYNAVKLLAGNDPDFANTRNDIGFNRLHVQTGHRLATMPLEHWSEYDLWAARKMLETYKNTQLKAVAAFLPPFSSEPPLKPWQVRQQQQQRPGSERPAFQQPQQFRRLALAKMGGEHVAILEQNYDAEMIAKIKALPQRRYDGDKKRWYVPLHLDALEPLIEFAVSNGYDVPEDVEQAIGGIVDLFRESLDMSQATDVDRDFDLPDGLTLFPFQKAGVAYAERVGNVLIADEMGLGKTVQALVTVKMADQFPVVVVCPASLKRNWEREARKWLPGKRVVVLDGTLQPLRFMGDECFYDVMIVNYNSRILQKWMGELTEIQPVAIILDEAHAIKNPKAQQTKLVEQLAKDTGARIIALSGTPVVNRPMEFWQLVKILGHAKTLGGWSEYKRRYDNDRTEAHHELNVRARTHFMVRRLKKDVLKELPAKMYSTVPLEITNRERYEAAERDIAGFFATKKANDEKFLQECRNLADRMGLSGEARDAFLDAQRKEHFNAQYLIAAQNEQLLRWEALKQLSCQGKLASVIQWIEDFLDNSDQKLVVFVSHTSIGESIAKQFNADFIHGGVKPDDRLPMVDRFQNDPTARVIVGNLIAMGEGLTLTAASNVAFVEFGWNRKQHAQAEDRCHRIGQEDSVMIWNLVAQGTIEEEIIALIEKKRVVSEAIQDGDEDSQAVMMQQLEALVSQRLSGARMK